MSKKIRIEKCWDCLHCYFLNAEYVCRHNYKKYNVIGTEEQAKSIIPSWCPLADDNFKERVIAYLRKEKDDHLPNAVVYLDTLIEKIENMEE